MKRVLIIGAGFLQSFIIKRAKEMGYYTIAIDKNSNSPGFTYADEYATIDIVDQDACLRFAEEKAIDGVLTVATDYGVLSAAYIAQELKLPGLNYEVAKVIKNKYKVRKTLSENDIQGICQFYEIGNINELEDIKDCIKYPVMVKPCDGSGSKATKRIDDYSDLEDACNDAIKTSLIGEALIEDFFVGKEFGAESFVCNGEVYVLGVMGKHMTDPPDYAELGHYVPCQSDMENKIRDVVKNTIKALGINFGSVNMDLLVSKDYKICIVDIGARMGGNLIGSHIIPIGTGIDYMDNIIKAAVGDAVDLTPKKQGVNITTRLLALKPGKVNSLPDFEYIKNKCNVLIYHHLEVGDIIRKYHNNLDGCGYVIACGDDINEAERRADEALDLIDKGIVRN